jgi:hypothetical protein
MTNKTPETDALADSGLPSLTESEKKAAQKEGLREAAKDAAKESAKYLANTDHAEVEPNRYLGKDEIMQHAHIIDLGIDEFKKAVGKGGDLPENKVAGLLELERSGKNRTDYVRALCDRLGVKSPYEVTSAGPDYTNDITPVTKL